MRWPVRHLGILPVSAADKKESTTRDAVQHILCISLSNQLLQLKTAVVFHECAHVSVQDLDAVHIPGRHCTFPDRDIQPAVGIGLTNLPVRKQWRTASTDSPGQFRADPKERRGLRFTQEIVADNGTASDAHKTGRRILEVFEDVRPEGYANEKARPNAA